MFLVITTETRKKYILKADICITSCIPIISFADSQKTTKSLLVLTFHGDKLMTFLKAFIVFISYSEKSVFALLTFLSRRE